jgi:hypothetical protein
LLVLLPAAESYFQAFTQELEQFFGRAKSQFLPGINFLYPTGEPVLAMLWFWRQSNNKSSAHCNHQEEEGEAVGPRRAI